jgi:hypothetical protein
MTIAPEPQRDDAYDDAPEDAQPELPPLRAVDDAGEAARSHAIASGTSWLLWIAGLSLVNIACALNLADFSFAIGLFASQLVATVGALIAHQSQTPAVTWIACVIALIPVAVIGGLWRAARTGRPWVFLAAMVVYGLDFALLVAFLGINHDMDIVGVAIHAWALWSLWQAWRATRLL